MIDTHAHLMLEQFKEDFSQVVENALDAGVQKIINIGFNREYAEAAVKMAKDYENLYATVGFHPYDAADLDDDMVQWLKFVIQDNEKVVGVGECGLDYYKSKVPKDVQREAFRRQLELAQEVGLPVVIHCRDVEGSLDAYEECLEILGDFDGTDGEARVNAVFHCYTGPLEFAKRLWELDYLTSFTGCITYGGAEELTKVVKEVPMGKFMTETDCPFLAPQKFRGKRNEPAYVVEVVKRIAEIKGVSEEQIAEISMDNAYRFFPNLK